MSAVDRLRLEVAWSAVPSDVAPVWTDITRYWLLNAATSITRGRGREDETASAGTMSLTLDNSAATFDPSNVSGPYYGGIVRGRPIRVTYRDPTALGNMIDSASASFESATTGSWGTAYFGASASVTLSTTTNNPAHGTRSMRVTWPTSVGAVGAVLYMTTVIGRTYTARCRVYVTAGQPAVRWGDAFGATPVATSTTTGALETLSVTWTATGGSVYLVLGANAATTAGQYVDGDAFMMSEGDTIATFTTAPAVESLRFSGYIDAMSYRWSPPNGAESLVAVSCVDRLKSFGAGATLRSVVEEEHDSAGPACYFPMGEAETAGWADDSSGQNVVRRMIPAHYGTGGTLDWGAGTGPGTDGLGALIFSPVDASNGYALRGTSTTPINSATIGAYLVSTDFTLSCFVATSTNSRRVLALVDSLGSYFELAISGTGKLTGKAAIPMESLEASVSSSATVADGQTHHVALVLTYGTATARIYVDGVSAGTFSTTTVFSGPLAPWFTTIEAGESGRLYAGTMSHVAAYASALTADQVADLAASGLNGFTPERSDVRIARIAKWAGIDAAWLALDVGASTSLGHADSTGQDPLTMMQAVAATEDGVLFCSGNGLPTFHARSRRFNAAVTATFTTSDVKPTLTLTYDDQHLVNELAATGVDTGTVTITRPDSATAEGGWYRRAYQSLTTSASELESVATAILARKSRSTMRASSVTFDLLTASDGVRDAALALDVSARFKVTGLPASAPVATLDVFVEGSEEAISAEGWDLSVSVSPASDSVVWVLGDADLSVLGSTTRLGY